MKFGDLVDKVFWAATIGIAGYVASQVNNLSVGVAELNVKVATIMERSSNQEKRLDAIDTRLNRIESIDMK
jgi:hypothetical protein